MLNHGYAREMLLKLFREQIVVDFSVLSEILKTQSKMTVFRHLKSINRLTSFTHAGKFYTLEGIPDFDFYGLWFHNDIGFSNAGTLRETLVHLINSSKDGMTHRQLKSIVRIRAYDTLVWLVRKNMVYREQIGSFYVYMNKNQEIWREQKQKRKRKLFLLKNIEKSIRLRSEIIPILVATLQSVQQHLDINTLATELGMHQVDIIRIFEKTGIKLGGKENE